MHLLYTLLYYAFWLYLLAVVPLIKNHCAAPYLFALSGTLTALSLALVPPTSPDPFIDIFPVGTGGSDHLLSGENPYSAQYHDIYQGRYNYPPGYIYWPGVLLLQTASRWITGDIRYVSIVCQLIAAAYLWKRAEFETASRWLVALLWLNFPVSFVMIEKSWVDILMVGLLPLFLTAVKARKPIAAGIVLGLFISLKQYCVFSAVLAVPWLWNTFKKREFGKGTAATLLTFAAIMLPFIAWDPATFYRETVLAASVLPMRPDALTLQAWALHNFHYQANQSLVLVSYLVMVVLATAACWRRPTESVYLWALFATYSWIFLVGKQAFLNYYYWVAFLLILSIFTPEPRPAASETERES